MRLIMVFTVSFVLSFIFVFPLVTDEMVTAVVDSDSTTLVLGQSIQVSTVPVRTPVPVISPTAKPKPSLPTTPSVFPTPTKKPPVPTTYPYTGADLDNWFTRFASEYHVDRELLRKIAQCESGFNAVAVSKHGYAGLYQFSESSWRAARTQMGHDNNPDLRFDPQEAIRTAAFKISINGTGAWPACSK